MVARHSLGDIFLGVAPASVRAFMAQSLEKARDNHSRLVIPCAGRFTIAEAAAAAKWDMSRVEMSDVSLFSTTLGAVFSGRGVAHMGVRFSGELADFQQLLENDIAPGAILAGLKVAQLRPDVYCERIVRDDMLRHFPHYAAQIDAQLVKMKGRLGGLKYETRDIVAVCEEAANDPDAVLFVNPPSFSKGYTKLFDTKGLISWNEPGIVEFDSAIHRPRLTEICMGAKALTFMFRGRKMDDGLEDRAVFADQGKGRVDYVLCNRPKEAPFYVIRKKPTKILDPGYKFMPDDHEINEHSVLDFVEVSKSAALYYRDLFAHKLGVTRAERYFICTIDGYVMAVFGMFFSEVQRGVSGRVYETFGFTVPNRRYPRLNRLFMTAIVCKGARDCFQAHCAGAIAEVSYFQTTCISTTPEQKTHRGSIKLTSRELREDGRYKLVYGGEFKPWGFKQTIINWIARMKNVEKETGRAMGVSRVDLGQSPEHDQ